MAVGSGLSQRRTARAPLLIATALLGMADGCGSFRRTPPPAPVTPPPAATPPPRLLTFEATAYSITGTTASGMQAKRGVVAADPKILPLGSRIRVQDAGPYSGVYTVSDTGPAINGHEIDIFIPDGQEAKRFGRRKVQVEILEKK